MRLPLFKILVLNLIFFIGMSSCVKNKEEENINHTEFAARTIYFELSNHYLLNKLQLGLIHQLIPQTVTIDTSVFLSNQIYTMDFGKGFGCQDGVIRRGKIQIQKFIDSLQIDHYQLSSTWQDSFGIYLNNNWHYLQGSSVHVFQSNGFSILESQSLVSNSKLTTILTCDSIVFEDIWGTNQSALIGDYVIKGSGLIDGIEYNLNAKVKSNNHLFCPHSGTMIWNSWEYNFDPYNEVAIDDWVKITKNSSEYFFRIR